MLYFINKLELLVFVPLSTYLFVGPKAPPQDFGFSYLCCCASTSHFFNSSHKLLPTCLLFPKTPTSNHRDLILFCFLVRFKLMLYPYSNQAKHSNKREETGYCCFKSHNMDKVLTLLLILWFQHFYRLFIVFFYRNWCRNPYMDDKSAFNVLTLLNHFHHNL